jgi:hypothetical protein
MALVAVAAIHRAIERLIIEVAHDAKPKGS